MRRYLLLLFAVVTLLSGGCSGVRGISVTSCEIVSVIPQGLTSLEALIKVGIHNPSMAFEVIDLKGVAKMKGQPALILSADQIIVAAKSDKVYRIPLEGEMAEGFNPFQLLQLINNQADLKDVTIDVTGKVALRGGVGKKIDLKDIPLNNLIGR